MLLPARVAQALEEQKETLLQAAGQAAELRRRYAEILSTLSAAELEERLAGEEWPGARPTSELAERGLVVPFGERWETAPRARAWALARLQGVPTVAVDGSQIPASKEFAVPISLVQVAWYENFHRPGGSYVKDVRDEVVAVEAEEYLYAESRLNQRRFSLEMQVAAERLQLLPPDGPPVVMSDGSFVLSFISRLIAPVQQAYLQPLFRLLAASEERRVPVAGYVDLSLARDLVTMLSLAYDLPAGNLYEAQLLAGEMEVFDRTAAFECARGDILPLYGERAHDLLFVYLKTGRDRLPARIDFPRWVLDAGLLDHMVDIIRAEVVVGTGYPYALETADAAAVLTTEDRLAFYRLFQAFARESGLEARLPAKSVSKAHRR